MAYVPPVGQTTDPNIFLDNVKRADELVNGPAGTVPDRGGEPLDTWRQMMARNDAAVKEAQDSITILGLPFTTLPEAQTAADDGKIPVGAVTWVRNAGEASLADEYINNGGTLEATGRSLGARRDVLDISVSSPAADWLHEFSIVGNSTMSDVTVSNVPGTTTGVCVLIAVPASTTVYLGMPAGAYTRFRILDLPVYPVNGLTRAGSRYSYDGTGINPDDFTTVFNGVNYTCKEYTTAADAKYLLIYQSGDNTELPVIFSFEKESGYRQLSRYAAYHVDNDLTFTPNTIEKIKSDIGPQEAILPGAGINLVAINDSSSKLVGCQLEGETSQQKPALMTSSVYGDKLITWVAGIEPGKRYTLIADVDITSPRFRVGAYESFPERRAPVTHMINGLTAPSTRQVVTESNGVTYSYITFDSVSDAAGTDNYLAMNLTDTGYDVKFALVEGEFVAGLTYRAITENIRFGVPIVAPYAEIDFIKSKIFSQGKNLFDGHFVYGYSPNTSSNVPGQYSVFLNQVRVPTDATYKDVVAAIIPCLPGKKYAISRQGGSRFWVGTAKYMPSIQSVNEFAAPMKTLVNDDSLNSAVIETSADDRFLYVYLSNSGGVDWLQIEEGKKVTAPETYGWKFSPAAEAIRQGNSGGGSGDYISAGAGDGVTDDADDLQAVINLLTGKLSFDPSKKYFLGKTLTIDAAAVNALVGNRATFIVGGNFPAFTVTGLMTSGSANPGTNGALSKAHGGFLIDGVRIYGYVEGVGTGLLLSGMFKPRIRDCDIMYLQRGIQFSNLNRDVIISDNHVYACRDYGVYFDDSTDIHQLNILGNIITYCTKNIFLDNADIYNLQIVGNDIELGTYPSGVAAADKADIWINAQTSYVECVSVVGNTLEDHWTANQLIRLNGAAAGNIASVNIGDNSTGNALRDDINMGGVSNVSIGGHFKRSYGYAVRATGPIAGLKYSAGVLRSGGQGGGMFISEGAYIHRDVNMNGCRLSGDSANGAIVVTGATSLRNFTVGNSVIYDKSATSIRLQATSMANVRVDFNNIDNVDATDVTNAIEITAGTTLGKNSMMLNSARKGTFVGPAAFNVQGNF